MKNRLLLIPILALTALFSIAPSAICDDLPAAPAVVQVAQADTFDMAPSSMEKTILAKLHCESVLVTDGGRTAKFRAVYGDSEENKSFSKYTPSASLELHVTNPDVFESFQPGRDYLVSISPAPEAPAPA